MSHTLKVFLACVFGSFIGGLTALQMNGYLWWVGALVGGLVGYLSYDLRSLPRALSVAWSIAGALVGATKESFYRNRVALEIVVYLAVSLAGIAGFLVLGNVARPWTGYFSNVLEVHLLIGMVIAVCAVIVGMLTALLCVDDEEFGNYCGKTVRKAYVFINPVSLVIGALPGILVIGCYGVYKYFPEIKIGVKRIGYTLWHFFRLIHSDKRLLCFVDASLGAAIGFWSGRVLIGAVVGGILGVVNYEIVSKRLLHLVPASSQS